MVDPGDETTNVVREAWAGAPSIEDLEERALRLWHEHVVYREDPRWPGAGVFEGRQAALARFRDYTAGIGDAHGRLVEVQVRGEHAFCSVEVRGQGTASGAPVDHLWGYLVRVRDGRIAEIQAYLDPEAARAA